MNSNDIKPKNPFGYEILRSLSFSSYTYLSRECATDRLVVLKYFGLNRKHSFEKEAKMLAEIADFEGAPKLYFASEQKEEDTLRFCIGMEYIAGKSLFDLTQEKTVHFDWSKIGERLAKSLRRLHDHYGISHGDLSPKNILVRSVDHRVILIDWEFAEKIADQNLSSYESYRGTQGFNSLDGTSGLILKDQEALRACLKYCGVLDQLSAETKAFSGFFSKWFKGKK